ncbi:MAG: glycosyltransferase, partial [Spartobacteria bacterium]|nr:glycosyltransferase [Spartobacteria bacterium]
IPRLPDRHTPDNVRIRAANFFENRWQINSPIVCPTMWPRIRRLIREHDMVNIHSLAPGLALLTLYLTPKSKPLVATQHVGVIPLQPAFLDALQKFLLCDGARRTLKRGAQLTFVGEAVRQWFVEHANLPEAYIHMTPAGINHDDYYFVDENERTALQLKWEINTQRLNVLFVGRFYEKKGLPIIQQLAEGHPGISFTLVGSGPIDVEAWRLPNVRTVGYVTTEELRELYGTHDLFIMPSFGEGWPAVIPQAMACGLPCLISEECFQGYNRDAEQFLVCHRDVGIIDEMLRQARNGEVPLLRQRQAVADYSRAHWDWMKTARIYLGLFDQMNLRECKTNG